MNIKRMILLVLAVISLNSCFLFQTDDAEGSLIITEVGNPYYINMSSWIEVYNPSTGAVNLSDYELKASARVNTDPWATPGVQTFTLPSLSIPGGAYILIKGKLSASQHINGAQIVFVEQNGYQPWWSESGFVELLKNGQTVDFVRFGNDTSQPTSGSWNGGSEVSIPVSVPDDRIKSISRDINNTDTDSDSDWVVRNIFSPGGPNDVSSATDADNDGIPDEAESPGGSWMGMPLYDWGARTGIPDIFVHIDYMDSSDAGVIPHQQALDKIVTAFNSRGFAIHFDTGNLFHSTGGTSPANYDLDDRSHLVPFAQGATLGVASGKINLYDYKSQYMDIKKRQVFHYCLFAYSQNADGSGGSSGLAEIYGNDLIVSLGNWGLAVSNTVNENTTINFQAATLMHELGHNLGLGHGGDSSTNYKPNYYSIMNYMYQLYGLPTIGSSAEGDRFYYNQGSLGYDSFWKLETGPTNSNMVIDYSSGAGGDLDESSLIESQGLRQTGSTGVDWNGDSDVLDSLSMDLNGDGGQKVLHDHDDWSNIKLFFSLYYSGIYSGATPEDPDPRWIDHIENDHQEVIVETLTRPH